MAVTVSAGDAIAAVAILLSAYAIWVTSKFNKRQITLIESQKRLNDLLLKQGETQQLDAMRADLGAAFINIGTNKYRLKIFNKGKAAARNVRIEFPEGNNVVHGGDIEDKFPMEIMERHQSVELLAIVHMNTKAKHVIRLLWSDDASAENSKTIYPTI